MKKILFVGNSHTYYNDMPYMVKYLAHSTGEEVDVTMLTKGGESLAGHLADEQVRFNILYGNYDYVVFQEVVSGFPGQEIYTNNLHNLLSYVKEANSKAVIYMVWAPEYDEPEKWNELIKACNYAGEKENIPVARVGEIWKDCLQEHSELQLYYRDHRHASPLGSYLTALCLVKTIFEVNPLGLPNVIKHGSEILVHVQENIATTLQKAVANHEQYRKEKLETLEQNENNEVL